MNLCNAFTQRHVKHYTSWKKDNHMPLAIAAHNAVATGNTKPDR